MLSLKSTGILKRYVSSLFAFGIMFLMIRMLEIILSASSHLLPEGAFYLYAKAIALDLLYFCFMGLLFALIYIPAAWKNTRVADYTVQVLMGVFLLGYALLVSYFAYGMTPLGADLYGYSWSEIKETALTSIVHISFWLVLPVLFIILVYFGTFVYFRRINYSDRIARYTSLALVSGSVLYLIIYPDESNYNYEHEYALVVNKAGYFYGHTVSYLNPFFGLPTAEVDFAELEGVEDPEYPLWRRAGYTDVLEPYLETGSRPPNLVFVLVEGLGSSFMGPYADYGGFTPYLDSLAEKSLFWTHFLSTSGRSFAVQPSILGSLPFGRQGFMEMGFEAPHHQTLLSILNENNYHTAYYAGYDVSFDKLDVFLGRQGTGFIMDEALFGNDYTRITSSDNGFSWGYSDKSLFRRSFDFIEDTDPELPRVDMYFTLNLHEPFIIENQEYYTDRYRRKLEDLSPGHATRRVMNQYPEIFSALLYTDDAIRELMERYRKRSDYENTIFIITGDHRIIPVNHKNRIDRYWVPFMIYSPLLKKTGKFHSVSSHLNVPHTILSHLKQAHGLDMPEYVHWLGGAIDMETEFRSVQNIPLIRNKNQTEDFLAGAEYLSGGRLFELEEGMNLKPVTDRGRLQSIQREFDTFRQINHYVTAENKLMPADEAFFMESELIAEEDRYFEKENLADKQPSELFDFGRTLIFDGNKHEGRIVLRRLLRMRPGFIDARLLYGRSLGWNGEYEEAMGQFIAARERNPGYYDVYNALADVWFWQGYPDKSVEFLNQGLGHNPNHPELLYRLARAYNQKGDIDRAMAEVSKALELDPEYHEARELRNSLD